MSLVMPAPIPVTSPGRRIGAHVADRHPFTSTGLDDLFARVAAGDRAAFAAFYDRIADAVFGTVLKVLRDRALAEEVSQEAFLEIWRKAPAWDPERGAATTWALVLARRRAIDRVRREEAMRSRDQRTTLWAVPDRDSVAEDVIEAGEHEAVRRSLDSLTDLQREAIELAYYGGMTQGEIAARLDVPLGTIKTRMRDGLLRLRATFGMDMP